MLPCALVLLATLIPIVYLIVRASGAEAAGFADLVLRKRNLILGANTLALALGVVLMTMLIATPLAWLTTSTNLRGRYLITILAMMPLATPGYVVAYAFLSLGSPIGPLHEIFGITTGRMTGYLGALIALTVYNFPFMYLNLQTAFRERDPAITDAGKSLGLGRVQRFLKITMPQLRPAFLAGGLLVGLYVFGDFGVVSLMRFETMSYAIFMQYLGAYDRVYAAWLSLMLIGAAGILLFLEVAFLRRLTFWRSAKSKKTRARKSIEGGWRVAAYVFVAVVAVFTVVVPNSVVVFWVSERVAQLDIGRLAAAMADSLSVSVPAAVLAMVLSVPVALLEMRYRGGFSGLIGRTVYAGYATPPLALALGFVFFVLHSAPWLYQTIALLVLAYTTHFLAQAVGPVRTTLFLATPRIEEASRMFGYGPLRTFYKVTLPILRPGLVGAGAIVFLSCIKELPITFLLAPLNFETLSLNVYSYTTEAMFAEAAPYAFVIVTLCAILVSVVFRSNVEFR